MAEFKLSDGLHLSVCSECSLNNSTKVLSHIVNKQVVDILVIGQSPGMEEIRQGRPFIGKSGALVNPVLNKYSYSVAYINVLLCRPADVELEKDRQPAALEVKCCRGRFDSDFEYILSIYKPKIIIALGVFAKKEMQRWMKTNLIKIPVYATDTLRIYCVMTI